MIQELLGGPGFNNIGGERKFSITETILQGIPSPSLQSSSSSSSSLSSSSTTTAAAAAAANNSSSNSDNNLQNLRCPRCDSSNTKFCYYNNYNLTQPRHFCKTCRRYWTKGGALRNVPIGGGCRKNKSSSGSIVSNSVGKSSTTTTANKMKTVVGYEIAGRSNLGNGFDHHHHHHLHQLPTSPVMWASPQNSQLLAILRATQQNNHVKEEGGLGLINGTPLMATDQSSSRTMVLDPLINNNNLVPSSLGLCSSLWKNNHHHQAQQYQQQQNGILVGHEVQNSGIQELYQRLKSSTTTNNNYYSDHQHHHQASTIVHGNATCSASSTSTILESAPVAGGDHQLGYWNPALSWSDLQTTTNGAYP